jgi:ribosomal protein S11
MLKNLKDPERFTKMKHTRIFSTEGRDVFVQYPNEYGDKRFFVSRRASPAAALKAADKFNQRAKDTGCQ